MADRIRVGIIGVQPGRSWGAVAHLPALAALPGYEVTALSNTRQDSADAAASAFGIRHAFDNHAALVTCADVDLVAVTVKVPHHFELVTAALNAGKHVYCEWPLGNGMEEARSMAALAKERGVTAVIGLQARVAPAVRYVADLVRDGYVGEVLSTTLVGTAMNWGGEMNAPNAYTADKDNGVTVLTIPVSHSMDALCHVLGEVQSLSATTALRRQHTTIVETGETLPMTAEDQVAFSAQLENDVVASVHYRGGLSRGTGLLWEINGSDGDMRVSGEGGHLQIVDLRVEGASRGDATIKPLPVPESYFGTALREGTALNVAEFYLRLEQDLRNGTTTCPTFEDAVRRHRMIEAVETSAAEGRRTFPADF